MTENVSTPARRLRPIAARCLSMALVALGPSASLAQGVAGGLSTQNKAPTAQLARALSQINLVACAAVMQRAADFLFEEGSGNFTIQPLGPDANRWPTTVTIESTGADNSQTRFATLIIAPSGTCSGFYQQTIYWPEPCATLRKTTFATYVGDKVLFRNIQISEANAGLQLYLMPAGAGCVSIKKELLH